MATAAPQEDWPRSIAEFQAWHARQPERWEFIEGWPRLMAPASMTHSIIKRNVFRALDHALGVGPCEVLVDGPQILTDEISAIPDVVVTCAALELTTPVVAEPAIIVEVMSPASEADDTGRKWLCYQKIPSLKHYLVLAQDRCLVQVHSRAGDLWRERFERRHDRARRSPPPPGRRRPLRPDRPRGVDRPILRRNDGKGPRRNNT
jgi:Uma2 family endonuclease